MTIEEHIKQNMVDCPLSEKQEGKLILALENYLDEIEQVKNCSMPSVSNNEAVICPDCNKYKRMQGNGIVHQLCECSSEVAVCENRLCL